MLNEPMGKKRHGVHIESREKATVSGVHELDSFNEEEMTLVTEQGTLTISGEGMHIDKLNLDEGQLVISGYIYALEYEDEARGSGTGFFSRLLGR